MGFQEYTNIKMPKAVQEMAHISLSGNIVPPQWFKTITFDNGKPDTNSILILADICYWYRPTEIRDERSGAVIGHKKKFSEDLLRKSYSDLQAQFGLSDRQLRDCFSRLEKRGVIRRVFRTLESTSGRQNNVMYIELMPSVVKTLTHGLSSKPFQTKGEDPINMDHDPYHDRTGQGVTSNGIPITIERDTYPVITGDHIETNTSSETSSKISLSSGDPRVNAFFAQSTPEREIVSIKMILIWNEIIPEKTVESASPELHQNLERALRGQLEGNLENWKVVCENFKSSKFLMGEAEGIAMKPSLSWLIDPHKAFVSRVFSKEQWVFDDRVLPAKPAQDVDDLKQEIEASSEENIVKDLRLFVLQFNPGFYTSYVKQAKFNVGAEGVQLVARSAFAKEKILDVFFEKMIKFLQEKYKMRLVVNDA